MISDFSFTDEASAKICSMRDDELYSMLMQQAQIPVRMFRGNLVMTFKDVSALMGCINTDAIRKMFSRRNLENREDRFVDGYHYFSIKPAHIERGEPYPCISPTTNTIDKVLYATDGDSYNLHYSNRGAIHLTKAGFSLITSTMRNPAARKIRACIENYYFDAYYVSKNNYNTPKYPFQMLIEQMRYVPLDNMDIRHIQHYIDIRARLEMHYGAYSLIRINDIPRYNDICNYIWNMLNERYRFIKGNLNNMLDAVLTFPVSITIATLVDRDKIAVDDK